MGTTNQIEIFNDLIQINQDRISNFQRAIEKLNDAGADLQIMFQKLSGQCKTFNRELKKEVKKIGGHPMYSSVIAGRIFRKWTNLKATLRRTDKDSAISACVQIEEAVKDAYTQAIESGDLNAAQLQVIREQAGKQKNVRDRMKRVVASEAASKQLIAEA